MKSTLAIIGRPNVGKSTLFNRIVGSRKALIMDSPGVTRDRNFAVAEWQGREFMCIDTGGFPVDEGSLEEKVMSQIDLAIAESDAILCVFDGISGLIPEEEQIVSRLRKVDKPVFYAVNKIDVPVHQERLAEFYSLGVENLYPVSGEHGFQLAELLDKIVPVFPAEDKEDALAHEERRIAIVGRPNVGKSSLVNALIGQARVVVDETPGTTRDSIDTGFEHEGHPYLIIDTAGMRRRSQKGGMLEKLTVLQSTRAIDRSDMCLLVLSADEGVLKQDSHIVGYIAERGKGLIIVWNKMDLKTQADQEKLEEQVREEFAYLWKAPLAYISALEGSGVSELFPMMEQLREDLQIKVPTSRLNTVFEDLVEHHPLPLYKGKEVKLYYATQVGASPPIFVVFCNHPQGVPESYKRYLAHGLQKRLDMEQIPVRVVFRKRR